MLDSANAYKIINVAEKAVIGVPPSPPQLIVAFTGGTDSPDQNWVIINWGAVEGVPVYKFMNCMRGSCVIAYSGGNVIAFSGPDQADQLWYINVVNAQAPITYSIQNVSSKRYLEKVSGTQQLVGMESLDSYGYWKFLEAGPPHPGI